MAPGLALESLVALEAGSVVLDPMTGSGTVLRQAAELGHTAVGFDLDPLAVLMSSVWNTPVSDEAITSLYSELVQLAADFDGDSWQVDKETALFAKYWFGPEQIDCLSQLASALRALSERDNPPETAAALNVLKLNLSRIIITKEQAASLARDTSHSRPHRVSLESSYDVFEGYSKSLRAMRDRLYAAPPPGRVAVQQGDARDLTAVQTASIDAVVTSPPYLNAIDYIRGHRLALIWLGWNTTELRAIRSGSIGAERASDGRHPTEHVEGCVASMTRTCQLPPRHERMVHRYGEDVCAMVAEVVRVLKPGGTATFVVGNSCLKDQFIKNADGVAFAAEALGLRKISSSERDLPQGSRYLPTTGVALAKRMRTETVLTFCQQRQNA